MTAVINEATQYLNTNGKPFVGGSVFIGTVGLDPELNPITIYSDRELTTPIANPQTLDSYGRSANKIWIPGKYSIKIEDVDSVQVYQELDAGSVENVGNTVLTDVLGADTITANAVNTITSYVDGQTYIFTAAANNTGPATLNIDGLGAKAIQKNYTIALFADDLDATFEAVVVYNGDNDIFQFINPPQAAASLPTGYLSGGLLTLPTVDDVETAIGTARDNSDTYDVTLTNLTKDVSSAWVVGDTNGGLFNGSLVAYSAYDYYAILLDADFSTIDYGCDLYSAGITNFPPGYTNYILLGRFWTDENANVIEEIHSTDDRGLPVAYSKGGVMQIGFNTTPTAISAVSAGTNGARFAFVAGPTNITGDTVEISGFTTNPEYNGIHQIGIVNAAYFEVNTIAFNATETGFFAERVLDTIEVSEIAARDDLNTDDMVGASMTKDLAATWATGNGNGGLFSGSVAADTIYYFFAIKRDVDGVIDYGFDTSIIAANIPTGYTAYKFLSRLLTDSGSLLINSMQGVYISYNDWVINGNVTTTLSHGLNSNNIDWQASLITKVAQNGYVVGDEQPITLDIQPLSTTGALNAYGTGFEFDAIQAVIRSANIGNVFQEISKSTGNAANITDTSINYKLVGKVR